jgi:hypothetical protein
LAVAANLFAGAEVVLVTSDGSLGERVYSAYSELALPAVGCAPMLPAPIGLAVTDLHASLTGGYAREGADVQEVLRSTVRSMSSAELQRSAMAICTIADYLQDALEDERRQHRTERATCSHCGAGKPSGDLRRLA